MRLFLTGGSGYLGTNLIEALKGSGHEILCLVNRSPLADSAVKTVKGNLSNIESFKDALVGFRPEALVHMGALSSPKDCEQDALHAHQVNTESTGCLVRVAKELGAHFVFLSTDWVFDASPMPEDGYKEDTVPCCQSVYGKSKRAAECAVLEAGEQVAVLRSSLMYGPELHGRRSSLSWLDDGLRGLINFSLIEDEWRTPVFIEDVITCISVIIERRISGVYHCAGPERMSRSEFGELYAECFGLSKALINKVKRGDVPELRDRPADLSMNSLATQAALGLVFSPPGVAFKILKQRNEEGDV